MSINKTQLVNELGNYFRVNNKLVKSFVYQKRVTSQFFKPIYKVKGEFPALSSVTGRVIQAFQSVWNEVGETQFTANKLTNSHLKVNYPIIPDDIEASWLAELDANNQRLSERPITQYILEKELMPAIARDQEYLFGRGDTSNSDVFLSSMNGLVKIFYQGQRDADNPMYNILLPTPTPSNEVANVEAFEEAIPYPFYDNYDMPIFMSSRKLMAYKRDYRNEFGSNFIIAEGFEKVQLEKSYLTGRQLIGLPSLNGTDIMFMSPAENMLRLQDIIVDPIINDIQILDYKVKIFMDWWDGLGFWSNQMVFVASYPAASDITASGLKSDNDTYYPNA